MTEKPLTADEVATWPLISQALDQVREVQNTKAFRAITQRLSDGLIRSVAARGFIDSKPTAAPILLSKEIWETANDWQYVSTAPFWTTNDLEVSLPIPGNYSQERRYRFYTVRLDSAGIAEMIPSAVPAAASDATATASAPAPPTAAPPTNTQPPTPVSIDPKDRRGPSPKDFWDDMLLAMFRRIHVEAWQPVRLADIEKAMHDWLAKRGKTAGERTIRNIAKKLFEALKD